MNVVWRRWLLYKRDYAPRRPIQPALYSPRWFYAPVAALRNAFWGWRTQVHYRRWDKMAEILMRGNNYPARKDFIIYRPKAVVRSFIS